MGSSQSSGKRLDFDRKRFALDDKTSLAYKDTGYGKSVGVSRDIGPRSEVFVGKDIDSSKVSVGVAHNDVRTFVGTDFKDSMSIGVGYYRQLK